MKATQAQVKRSEDFGSQIHKWASRMQIGSLPRANQCSPNTLQRDWLVPGKGGTKEGTRSPAPSIHIPLRLARAARTNHFALGAEKWCFFESSGFSSRKRDKAGNRTHPLVTASFIILIIINTDFTILVFF